MNITREREAAQATIREWERISEILWDGQTYAEYSETIGGPSVIAVMQARDMLAFLDKVETMDDFEIERITSIPTYQDDMWTVKDIKDKYGLTWSEMQMLRGGIVRDEPTKGQGERLKAALKDAGLNQTEYSKMRGIPIRTLQNWISEKTILSEWLLGFVLKDLNEIAER